MADNFDNYGMKVQATASVKMPTASEIDKQIRNLEKSISKLQISGKLDDSSLKNLSHQLDTLKATVTTANFSPTALTELTNQVNRALQNINIGNINVGNIGNQAQQVGQQIGATIAQGVNSAIQKSGGFKSEYLFDGKNPQNKVTETVLKDFQKLSDGIVTVKEQMKSVGGKSFLDGFTVSIEHATGQVETLAYKLKDIEGKTGQSFQYTSGSINDNGVIKQMNAISAKADSLQTKLDKLKANYSDVNASRPIKDSGNISALSQQYDKVAQAIENVRNADNSTFSSIVSNAQKEITTLETMVSQFRNAENVATQMKSVDISSGIAQAQERLGKLKANASGFEQMTDTIRNLDIAIEGVGDKSSLDKFINDLRTAETQLGRVKAEAKQLEQVNKIQLLSNGGTKNDYATQIAKLEGDFRSLGLSQDTIATKTQNVKNSLATLRAEFTKPVDQQNFQAIQTANDNLQRELIESRNEFEQLRASMKGMATEQQRLSLANTIEAWNQKNTAATKAVREENDRYIASLRDLNTQMTKMQLGQINTSFKQTENSMRGLNKLGASLANQWKQATASFTMWLSASTMVMRVISETREAFTELKEINTILTEISKANDNLTKDQLTQIGNNSFDIASKYGKTATDFLSGVQEASRAGYANAEAMAELSTAAQGAGDMTADVANQFIIATDKAYKFGGSVQELTKMLDGVNYITNHNAVNMTELSEAMTIVGSTAASFGVETDELTAALGTMAATTQQSGSEVARAFRAILLNIRQVSDEEEGIDAEGLTKYEKACNALGVSLKETRNGVLQTRDAMDVLRDLSVEYSKLEENDLKRTNLLNSVGGKLRSTQLDALLRNWSTYETMLQQYADGTGSMQREADKTAKSWEGSLNRLKNTWTDTIENIANSDGVISIINGFEKIISGANKLTDTLGTLGSIGLGVGLFAGIKNIGQAKMWAC